MFLTSENFNIEPYRLSNIDGDEDFIALINKHEKQALIKILGRLLYDALIAGLFDMDEQGVYTPKGEDDIEQRWKDLRDGIRYTYSDKPYFYDGIIELLTPFIFSIKMKYSVRAKTSSGTVVTQKENANAVDSSLEIANAYNNYSSKVGNYCEQKDTLFGYLYTSGDMYFDVVSDNYDSITAYMDDVFKAPGRMNRMGI